MIPKQHLFVVDVEVAQVESSILLLEDTQEPNLVLEVLEQKI